MTLTDATSGTFRLAFEGEITSPLDYNATAASVETALEALESIGSGNVSVSKTGAVYTVTFSGDLAATNVTQIFGDVRLDSDGTEQEVITMIYDDAFRLIEIDDSWADYEFTLDNLGRTTATVESIVRLSPDVNLDAVFDANGNRTSLAVEIGSGFFGALDYENSYTFDNLNRLVSVEQTDQSGGNAVADKRVNFVFNGLNQLTYDSGNRLTALQHRHVENSSTSSALAEYTYTYDDMGRITEIDSTQDGVSTYTFDATSQLTDADHASGRTDEAYTFDSTGNRTGGDYVVSAKNRTDESTGYEYEYDRNGNRIKRLKTADNSYELYEYDHRNRLITVDFYNSSDVLQKTIDYAYDAFNRMVRRTFDADGPGGNAATDQLFAGYDGIHATLEFDGPNKEDVTHRYLWGLQADQLLADEQVSSTSSDGDILWTLGDQVGTIRDIAEWNGTSTEFEITNHREYDSFGNLISETDSSVDVSFGFTGKWTDPETGYTHHLNRWYDPVIGKWLSEDPIGFEAGDTNIQRYVANQVLSMIDTNGLDMGIGQGIANTGGASQMEVYEDPFGEMAFGIAVGDPPDDIYAPPRVRSVADFGLGVAERGITFVAGMYDEYTMGVTRGLREEVFGGEIRDHAAYEGGIQTQKVLDKINVVAGVGKRLLKGGAKKVSTTLGAEAKKQKPTIPKVTNRIDKKKLKYKPKKRGNAPIGEDGHPVELHHNNQANGLNLWGHGLNLWGHPY